MCNPAQILEVSLRLQIGQISTLYCCLKAKPSWGTDTSADVTLDQAKVKAALERQQKEEEAADEEQDERKRKYNSIAGSNSGITDEDMEAYRLRKARMDDPMASAAVLTTAQNGYDFV